MNTTQPIRNPKELRALKDYYQTSVPNMRNHLLIILGLNTALRISDILSLCWNQVYDFSNKTFRRHISLVEQKTGKRSRIYMNQELKQALNAYQKELTEKGKEIFPARYLFLGQKDAGRPISRIQAYRIIHEASAKCQLSTPASCHSLRKTFGHQALKQGVSPAILMNIYNHSSFQITKRYLGIEQEERDAVFKNICL